MKSLEKKPVAKKIFDAIFLRYFLSAGADASRHPCSGRSSPGRIFDQT
jgi:hypothetical protein